MSQKWIYKLNGVDDWTLGTTGYFWTPAREDGVGDIILRKDGLGAGEPRWDEGDEVVAYDMDLGQCVAITEVASQTTWDEVEGAWGFDLRITRANAAGGPSPADVGIAITQGSRARLTQAQFDAVRSAL